jgi:Class III cytochrome C family
VQDCVGCHSDHAGPKLTHGNRKPFSHGMLRAASRDRCASCHASPDNTLHRNVGTACAQCHTSDAWKPATFEHDRHFLLDKDHNASCVTCHTTGNYKSYTCYGCHEHTPDNMRRKHVKEGIQNFENCVECHRSASEKPERSGTREGDRSRRQRD